MHDRIVPTQHDGRDRRGRGLGGKRRDCAARRDDDVRAAFDKSRRERGKPFVAPLGPEKIHRHITPFDEAGLCKAAAECGEQGRVLRGFGGSAQIPDHRRLDEAYLDVTENLKGIAYATTIAQEIRAKHPGRHRPHRLGRRVLQQVPRKTGLRST